MHLVFLTNMVHHHQLPLADEFYKLLGDDYCYIATQPLPDWLINGGYDPSQDRPYIIRTYYGEEQLLKARQIVDNSTIVIAGAASDYWTYQRKKDNKITFHYNERWLKKINLSTFHPLNIYHRLKNYTQFRNKQTFLLCANAFAAGDVKWYGAFPHKCFKWGYFTKVDDGFDINTTLIASTELIRIMWCSRFLELKHPELPIMLAERLKKAGYKFVINMYGSGEEFENAKRLATALNVTDVVCFCGNYPNDQILEAMRKHEIFLFTSDRNEGWGAVLNESMSNGCAVVASNEIGSVPYIINDGINGMVFKSRNINSLFEKVKQLIDNPVLRNSIRKEAIRTMQKTWSPSNAAKSFLNLSSYILEDDLNNYKVFEGPASWDLNN